MKNTDIAIIIAIVFGSSVLSFFISNKFISPPKRDMTSAVVEPITSDFNEPNKLYFNEKSVNPTQLIRIDNNQNQSPIRARQ